MDILRVGFAGFGRQAREFLLPLVPANAVQQLLVLTRGEALGTPHGTVLARSLREMREKGTSHLVIAASRHANEALLEEAIACGIPNIFVEKPPARSLQALLRLHGRASAAGVRCTVGMNFRAAPLLVDALELARLRGGVLSARVNFATLPVRAEAHETPLEAMLFEFGIHAVDLCCKLVDGGVVLASRALCVAEAAEVNALIEGPSGRVGALRVSSNSSYFSAAVHIVARDGTSVALADFAEAAVVAGAGTGDSPAMGSGKERSIFAFPARKSSLDRNGYKDVFNRFIAGRDTDAFDLASMAEAYHTMELLVRKEA